MLQGVELQGLLPLQVFQQGGGLLHRRLPAALGGLGPLHELGGFVAHIPPVGPKAGIFYVLPLLRLVGPGGRPPGRALQTGNLPLQALLLRRLPGVPGLPVPPPGGEIPLAHLNVLPLQG